MRKTHKILLEVTPDEEELIAAIRNYCKTYPDGYPELLCTTPFRHNDGYA
jgi:hypothetical protein